MIEIICEVITSIGLKIDSIVEDEKYFGNIIVRAHKDFIDIFVSRDKGIWECSISFHNRTIPLKAIFYILEGKSFNFEELTFDSFDLFIEWLLMQNTRINTLTTSQLVKAKKIWITLVNGRFKNKTK